MVKYRCTDLTDDQWEGTHRPCLRHTTAPTIYQVLPEKKIVNIFHPTTKTQVTILYEIAITNVLQKTTNL